MARQDVETLKNRFLKLRDELKKYSGLRIGELPDELKKKLQSQPVLPAFTSGGLESVETAIRMLSFAQAIMDDVLANRPTGD